MDKSSMPYFQGDQNDQGQHEEPIEVLPTQAIESVAPKIVVNQEDELKKRLKMQKKLNSLVGEKPQAFNKKVQRSEEVKDNGKLLHLEKRFSDMFTNKIQDFSNKVYGFDALELIHEVVKIHKKNLPPVDLNLLKKKKLDVRDINTFAPPSNKFNQGLSRKPYVKQFDRTNDSRPVWSKSQVKQMSQLSRSSPPSTIVLHKAENAWKPKLRDNSNLDDDEAKYEKFRKSVRSLLNKVTPTTYDEIVRKFIELKVDQDQRSRKIAVDLIFDKSVEEPTFCGLYANLCKDQIDIGGKAKKSFCYILIQKVQSTFEGGAEIGKRIKELRSKPADEMTEKEKTELSNEIAFLESKKKRRIFGNIKLISHLYTAKFLGDSILSSCCEILHEMFMHSKDDAYVQYGIEMLELVSKLYYSPEKKEDRKNAQTADNLSNFINWLSTKKCKGAVSTRVKVLIMNFEDFMEDRRTTKNTGPKTLQQIQDEIKHKEQANLTDNENYGFQKKSGRQKKNGRMRNNTPPIVVKSRQNFDQKKTTAVLASSNTGSSAPPKKVPLMKRADKTNENKPAYFNKNKFGKLEMETDEKPPSVVYMGKNKFVGLDMETDEKSEDVSTEEPIE